MQSSGQVPELWSQPPLAEKSDVLVGSFFVSLVSLMQSKDIWKEETSTEEMAPSHWYVSQQGHFLD